MTGQLFDIEHSSFVDGPGIRTTVFFKGCNLKCAWCHNPESQSRKTEMLFYKDKCTGCGKCKQICQNESCTLCGRCTIYCPADARRICGKEYTVEEVIEDVKSDIAFYDNSGGGATFSGGECMLQIDFLCELLKRCKEEKIYTAVDTAGCVKWESFEKILPFTDMFLYDFKCFDSETHKKYVGVDNALILDNLKKLLKTGVKIWIRIPVITGVNDSVEEMVKIKEFFSLYGAPEKIELLPYHAMGENKYRALNKEPVIFTAPTKEKTELLKAVFN